VIRPPTAAATLAMLSLLTGCWTTTSSQPESEADASAGQRRESTAPTQPADPPDLPVDPAGAPPTVDTDVPAGPPLRPTLVQVQGVFGLDREAGVLRPFSLDGVQVPVSIDLVVFDQPDEDPDTPRACGLSLRPTAARPEIAWLAPDVPQGSPPLAHVGLELVPGQFSIVDHPVPAAGLPGCLSLATARGWSPEPWGADPLTTLSQTRIAVYLGPAPQALLESLPADNAYRRGVGLAGSLVTEDLGHAWLHESTGRQVDADWSVVMGQDGRGAPLTSSQMAPVPPQTLPRSGAYRILDAEQVFPAELFASE